MNGHSFEQASRLQKIPWLAEEPAPKKTPTAEAACASNSSSAARGGLAVGAACLRVCCSIPGRDVSGCTAVIDVTRYSAVNHIACCHYLRSFLIK